jgi:ribonucleoside-triphosphate reductase
VGWTDDPFAALEHQEELQRLYTGGTVFHMYLSERISSAEACKNLVRRTLERFRIPYLTITPTFSICPRHGYLPGEHEFCPRCDEEKLAARHAAGEVAG